MRLDLRRLDVPGARSAREGGEGDFDANALLGRRDVGDVQLERLGSELGDVAANLMGRAAERRDATGRGVLADEDSGFALGGRLCERHAINADATTVQTTSGPHTRIGPPRSGLKGAAAAILVVPGRRGKMASRRGPSAALRRTESLPNASKRRRRTVRTLQPAHHTIVAYKVGTISVMVSDALYGSGTSPSW